MPVAAEALLRRPPPLPSAAAAVTGQQSRLQPPSRATYAPAAAAAAAAAAAGALVGERMDERCRPLVAEMEGEERGGGGAGHDSLTRQTGTRSMMLARATGIDEGGGRYTMGGQGGREPVVRQAAIQPPCRPTHARCLSQCSSPLRQRPEEAGPSIASENADGGGVQLALAQGLTTKPVTIAVSTGLPVPLTNGP